MLFEKYFYSFIFCCLPPPCSSSLYDGNSREWGFCLPSLFLYPQYLVHKTRSSYFFKMNSSVNEYGQHWKHVEKGKRICLKYVNLWGAWVARSVEHPSLVHFMISRVHKVCGFEPHIDLSADSVEPASDPLFPSLSFPCSHSLKNN